MFQIVFFISRWVDQCDGSHDKNRNVERFYVGQNWAVSWGGYLKDMNIGASGVAMIQRWYDEVSNIIEYCNILENFILIL